MTDEEDEPRPSSPTGVDDYSAERIVRSRDSQPTALNGKPNLARAQAPSTEGASLSDGAIPVHVDSTPPESADPMVSDAEWTPSSSATTNAVGFERSVNTPIALDNRRRFWAVVVGFTALTGVAMFMLGRML